MPDPIPLNEWLHVIDNEYLSHFIREGGASIKFAVAPEESRAELAAAMKARCEAQGYLVAHLDAGAMRAHMPQDIFFGLARQLDWRLLARRRILSLAKDKGYEVGGIDPGADGDIVEALANAKGLQSDYFRRVHFEPKIELGIQNDVFSSTALAKDFRVAMSCLCVCESDGGEYTGQPIIDWLTGETTRISDLRPFPIYTSINRTTARYFIQSALHWVRHAGYAGTVILFDNSRVTLAPDPKDGLRYYTKAMTMDHYELLREFIDGADRLAGTLMLVITSEDFLDGSADRGSRGYGIYEALQTRVMNDVHDRNLANPVASLVRLS